MTTPATPAGATATPATPAGAPAPTATPAGAPAPTATPAGATATPAAEPVTPAPAPVCNVTNGAIMKGVSSLCAFIGIMGITMVAVIVLAFWFGITKTQKTISEGDTKVCTSLDTLGTNIGGLVNTIKDGNDNLMNGFRQMGIDTSGNDPAATARATAPSSSNQIGPTPQSLANDYARRTRELADAKAMHLDTIDRRLSAASQAAIASANNIAVELQSLQRAREQIDPPATATQQPAPTAMLPPVPAAVTATQQPAQSPAPANSQTMLPPVPAPAPHSGTTNMRSSTPQ